MAIMKSVDVQNILNTVPSGVWNNMFAKDREFVDMLGGIKPFTGRLSGSSAIIPVKYGANGSAASYGEDDSDPAAQTGSRHYIKQPFKRIHASFGADGLQMAANAAGGTSLNTNLIVEEYNDTIEDIYDELNEQALGDGTGNSSKDVQGVQYHIADDNTWNSMSRATYAWLKSYVSENGGTLRDLSKALLRGVNDQLRDNRKSRWREIWTSADVWNAYEDLLDDQKRFVNVKVGDVTLPTLEFDGRPVRKIPGYAANRMDFVNPSDFELVYLPQKSFDKNKNQEITGPFKVKDALQSTDAEAYVIYLYVTLICKNPWKQGSLQDVQ